MRQARRDVGITLKSEREIALMREVGRVVAAVIEALVGAIVVSQLRSVRRSMKRWFTGFPGLGCSRKGT